MNRIRLFAGWLLCVVFGLTLHFSGATAWLDRLWMDWEFGFMRAHFQQPAANDVVLVGIDEEFLRNAPEPLALMHRRFSILFEAVAAAKPRLTGLDLVLPEKSFSFLAPTAEPTLDFDRELSRGLLKLGAAAPLIIGETWDNARSRFRNIHPAFIASAGYWVGTQGPEGFDHRGSALVCPDPDGVVRQYPGAACQPGGGTRILVGQMASALDRHGDLDGYIHYGIGAPFSYLPATQVIAWQQSGDIAKLAQLTDKTVLIGVILDNEDRLQLPVAIAQWEPENRLVSGVALQAQMLRSVMNQGLVKPAPMSMMVLLIVLASTFWFGQRVRFKLVLFVAFATLVCAVALWALRATLFVPVVAVLGTAAVAMMASAAVAWRRHWLERSYLTKTFSGYVSPQILKGILSGTLAAGKAGQRQQVCVLFSDIRGFTVLSETLPAERVVLLLNRYFDRMARIVHRHGGLVDKFMGDGMMAIFGAPKSSACPEQDALEAARDMLLALDELNAEFHANGLPEITIGIGLHTGDAVIGHIGSEERHEYTAIGDAVNVAARICDLPKALGYPIVCSVSVAHAVGFPGFLEDAGMQVLKGHTDIQVFGWRPLGPSAP